MYHCCLTFDIEVSSWLLFCPPVLSFCDGMLTEISLTLVQVKHIWSRKLSFGRLMYLLARYVPIVFYVFQLSE